MEQFATYEQEMKALKEKWAKKKAEEKAKEKAEKSAKAREIASVNVTQAIKLLEEITDTQAKTELAPVVKRLHMFVNGERYTRNKGAKNE